MDGVNHKCDSIRRFSFSLWFLPAISPHLHPKHSSCPSPFLTGFCQLHCFVLPPLSLLRCHKYEFTLSTLMVSALYRGTMFYLHCTFSMVRYTNTYYCVAVASSIQCYTSCTDWWPRSSRLHHAEQVCSRLYQLGFASVLCGACTATKSL